MQSRVDLVGDVVMVHPDAALWPAVTTSMMRELDPPIARLHLFEQSQLGITLPLLQALSDFAA